MASFEFSVGGLIVIFLFMAYMIIGQNLEHNHCIIGHESGIIILIGMVISYVTLAAGVASLEKLLEFDPNFFFYFCLPPIVFAAGYNLKRKKFFENFTNILLFGLFSTLLTFSFFSTATYIVN